MSNTRVKVEKIIERDGAIRKDLSRGLINVRALTRFVQSKMGDDASLDAIMGAIRRYPIENRMEESRRLGRFLQKLTMRNKIADISLVNEPEVRTAVAGIASSIDYSRGETFRIVAGVEVIRVIMDEKNLWKLEKLPKTKVVKVTKDLAEIIVSLPQEAERTPGVVALVTTELAMNGINLIEIMSCVPELILVVEEVDALRGYELLEQLAKS